MKTEIHSQLTSPGFWDARYTDYLTVYGEEPNAFFKDSLQKLPTGKLLLPAEGEGRNAIFAASRGWQVDAFDYSSAAQSKALARAGKNDVNINYRVADINSIDLPSCEYDAIALIYIHLKPEERRSFHRQVVNALRPGGHLILEAFSRDQINNISGGPRNQELLYDLADLQHDFKDMMLTVSQQEQVRLNEGPFHQGKADVIRIFATKV